MEIRCGGTRAISVEPCGPAKVELHLTREVRVMRVGFFSVHNPYDRTQFSSTAYCMLEGLRRALGDDLRVLGRHKPPTSLRRIQARLPFARRGVAPSALDVTPEQVSGLDWIITLASSSAVPALASIGPARVALVTDATPGFLRDFYGWTIEAQAEEDERHALEAASLVVYSSRFMARKAAEEFGARVAQKAAAACFGVNMEDLPAEPTAKPPLIPLNLLFVGRGWERKGGDKVLEALAALRDRGVAARLVVIGSELPAGARSTSEVEVIAFLNKNRAGDRARLVKAFREAHFLLLPTRADCTPMVIAEANAYGAPALVSDVGGIESLVEQGVNGELLPLDADGRAYADRIMALTRDEESYRALARSSFRHYQARLNWDAWARDVLEMMADKDRHALARAQPAAETAV